MIGGAGFLGQHIVRRLISDGWVVRVFDILPSWSGIDNVDYVYGDLCKTEVSTGVGCAPSHCLEPNEKLI